MLFPIPFPIHKNTICLFLTSISYSEQQRAQKVFKAQQPLDLPGARNKLMGFGMQLLENVDPNPDNMVCAGIIHTQTQQVGCLLRLEPNKQAQVSAKLTFVKIVKFKILLFFFFNFISDVPTYYTRQQRNCHPRSVRSAVRSVLKYYKATTTYLCWLKYEDKMSKKRIYNDARYCWRDD